MEGKEGLKEGERLRKEFNRESNSMMKHLNVMYI